MLKTDGVSSTIMFVKTDDQNKPLHKKWSSTINCIGEGVSYVEKLINKVKKNTWHIESYSKSSYIFTGYEVILTDTNVVTWANGSEYKLMEHHHILNHHLKVQ